MSKEKHNIALESIVLNYHLNCFATGCKGLLENIDDIKDIVYDDITQCYQCDKCGNKYEVALNKTTEVELEVTPYGDNEENNNG